MGDGEAGVTMDCRSTYLCQPPLLAGDLAQCELSMLLKGSCRGPRGEPGGDITAPIPPSDPPRMILQH
jgi:hypothetical protein